MIREKHIDIILMDINLGKHCATDGLSLASQLLSATPSLKIIILTGYDLPVYRHESKKMGLKGFLNKNISPENLVAALFHVYAGNTCFSEEDSFIIEDLTATEKKILSLILNGNKRKNIAKDLFISERTLSNHLQHIFDKLGVSSSIEAVAKAIQLGYLPPI